MKSEDKKTKPTEKQPDEMQDNSESMGKTLRDINEIDAETELEEQYLMMIMEMLGNGKN